MNSRITKQNIQYCINRVRQKGSTARERGWGRNPAMKESSIDVMETLKRVLDRSGLFLAH